MTASFLQDSAQLCGQPEDPDEHQRGLRLRPGGDARPHVQDRREPDRRPAQPRPHGGRVRGHLQEGQQAHRRITLHYIVIGNHI